MSDPDAFAADDQTPGSAGDRGASDIDADLVARTNGIFATPPGLVTDDFDDLIDEALSDYAAWVVARMRQGEE
jgi:hypothetical protein